MKFKSLKTKLLFGFILVGLLPLAVFGFLSIQSARQDLEREIADKLVLLAESKEGQVFAYLDSLETRTLDFSSDGFIRDSLKEISQTGSKEAVKALNNHLINNKKPLDPSLSTIFVIDLAGRIVAATAEEEIGKDESEDVYFQEGKKGPYSTELKEHTHFPLKRAFIVTAPLTDKETGQLLGVIANVFDTEKLSRILSGAFQTEKGALPKIWAYAQTVYTYVVNSEKIMFVHGKGEGHFEGMGIDTLPVRECLENKKEIAGKYLNYEGEEIIGASMCFPGRGWILLVEIKAKEALAPVRAMEVRLGLVTLLFVFLVGLAALVFTGHTSQPIKKLHEGTEIIAGGNLDYRVEIKTGDEIQQLAEAFNLMAGKLKGYYQELEEKVKEKTSELAQKVVDLENAEKAMLNLLEDARELEKELAKEKASVERKVIERTQELAEKNRDLEEARQKITAGWMQLQKEKARLTASIHGLGLGFLITDERENIIMMNQAAKTILGREGHVGNIRELTGSITATLDLSRLHEQCLQQKKTVEVKEVLVGMKFLRLLASPIMLLEDHNRCIGSVILIEDITEAKALERSRDEFFSIASHELRTPLTAIRGNATLLQDYYREILTDPMAREMVADMHDSAVRLIDIVNDFLDMSRLEMGKIEFKKELITIEPLVDESLKEFAGLAKEKGLVLSFAPPAVPLPQVVADHNQTKQVILNLLSNSLKFTDRGTVTVMVEPSDGYLKVSIADTGRGIPRETQNLLFRKFQQAEENLLTRDATKGTGLGLYISKLLVEGMGGNIWLVSSEEGRGSTFAFRLPTQ